MKKITIALSRNNVNNKYEEMLAAEIKRSLSSQRFVPTTLNAVQDFYITVDPEAALHSDFRKALRLWIGTYNVTNLRDYIGAKHADSVEKILAREGYYFNPTWVEVDNYPYTSILIKKEDVL